MKNSCLIFVFCLLLTQSRAQNLLQNGGFENGVLDWHIGSVEAAPKYSSNPQNSDTLLEEENQNLPLNKEKLPRLSIRPEATFLLEISDEKQNRGINSLQLAANESAKWSVRSNTFIPVQSGAVYELQAFLSIEKMKLQSNLNLVFFDKDKKEIQKSNKTALFLTGIDNWQVFVTETIVPKDVAFTQIEISGIDTSEIWLDDLVFKKSQLINKQGDFSIENDFLTVTIHLPSYAIDIFDKKLHDTYTTLPVSGFITENVTSLSSELRLKSNFLTENMTMEFVFHVEENRLKIEINPTDPSAPMFNDLEFPGAISSKKGQKLVVSQYKSLFLPVEQAYPSYGFSLGDTQNTSGLVGVKGEKSAYFIATETPEMAGFSFPENNDNLHEPQLWHSAENGLWGHKRIVYIGVTEPDYEQMSIWYRDFAQSRGWALPPVLQKQKEQYNVKILPNPAIDVININFDATLSERIVLLIHDVNGKNLMTETLDSGMDSYRFGIDHFPAGLYQIHLLYPSGHQQTMRFLKN
jgi:hypothetical protein